MPRSQRVLTLAALCTTVACSSADGLPLGTSIWDGTFEVGGVELSTELVLQNDEGDLSGEFEVLGTTSTFTGTYDPVSHRLALLPLTNDASLGLEQVGLEAQFDPETDTFNGVISDTAAINDNVLRGGPAQFTLVEADGDRSKPGDGALGLTGPLSYTGTFRCETAKRPTRLDLTSVEGRVTGSITFAETDLATDPVGTFTVTGVHNASNGNLSLLPGLWTESFPPASYATFWWDLAIDVQAGTAIGDSRNNRGRCDADQVLLDATP